MKKFLLFIILIFLFTNQFAKAQNANFTYSVFPIGAPQCEGVTLIFSDATTGTPPTSWAWNFGPGAVPSTSTQQNPGIVNFPICNPLQQVTLVINGGGPPLFTETQTVPIYCNPTACFTVNPPTACAGTPFSFNSSCSSIGAGASTMSFQWDVCNGAPGIVSPNPVYTYPEDSGCFCTTLLLTNNRGCTDDTTVANAACITPPPSFLISALGPTTTCLANLSVDFCATPVTGGSPPYSYSWTFQGGTPATSNLACPISIDYTTGSYDVTCVVTDAFGCSTIQSVPAMINVGNTSTSIIINDTSLCVGECVTVSTGISNTYSWSIAPTACATPSAVQATPSVNYCFSCPGAYTVDLTANVNGCIVTADQVINVFPKPVACINLTSNVPACSYPQTVNVAYCGNVGAWTYNWQFPGGTPSSSNVQNPGNIVYNACGRYSITLTVSGAGGCDSTIYLTDTVKIDCIDACYTITNLPIQGKFCTPLSLNFNANCSTGSPTQYLWCFQQQGGVPCVSQNLGATPSFTFDSVGCYDVKLKIINGLGCTDSVMNIFPGGPICVGEHTEPCFTAVPWDQCAPLPVAFFNCTPDSNGVPGGPGFKPCHSWSWNFESGLFTQSVALNPEWPYTDTGCFTVTLISKNCGCFDTLQIEDTVCIWPPIPTLNYYINCDSPNIVLFDGSNSIGADVFYWTFPGGNPSSITGPIDSVLVTYPMPNPNAYHTAQMKICNTASGCCDSVGVGFFLRDIQAYITVDTLVCWPQTSAVTNTSLGVATYVWKIYDSCNNNTYLPALYSTSPVWHPSTSAIAWPGPGIYNVEIKLSAINGCDTFVNFVVTVQGVKPEFWGDSLTGCAPLTVNFTDTSQANCVSFPVSYSFNFGDGSSPSPNSPSPTVTHTYNTNGTFNVALSVTDQYGCVVTDTTMAYVIAQIPTADFYIPDPTICLGTPACFINISTGINLTYLWNFGDGTTSVAAAPCHTYLSSGIYTVQLNVTDINGCFDSLVLLNYIVVGEVDVDFYGTPDTMTTCPPLAVTFLLNPPVPNGCGKYYWSFGDGTFSNYSEPFHIYAFAGSFNVTLVATDTCLGCSSTIVKQAYIDVGGPYSNPEATPDTACLDQLICFDLTPTNSASFLWDFDDGSPLIAGGSAICHLYSMPDTGIFLPSVVLTDSAGICSYTRIVDTLVLIKPIAKFTSSTNDLCSNGTVTFTNNSWSFGGNSIAGIPYSTITNYEWDFGDGSPISNDTNPPPHTYNVFGDYYVSLTITSVVPGCTATVWDTIHVTQAPIALPVPPVNDMCLGSCTGFIADTSTSSIVCAVFWDFGDPTNTNDTSSSFNTCYIYPVSGNYTVTLIAYGCNGCNDTATMSISIAAPPIADAGLDATICNDSSVLLIGAGGVSYEWIDPNPVSLSSLNTATTTASPTINSTYTLIVTDAAGCQDTDEVEIFITPPPVASITAGDSICPGSSFTLTASGGTSYQWSNGETTQSITVTPDSTEIFTVIAFVGTCGDDTSATVIVMPLPIVNAGNDDEVCLGNSVQLIGTTPEQIHFWSPATVDTITNLNPIASPTVTTTYTLTVTDVFGCTNTDEVVIIVNPLPPVSVGPDKKICSDTYTQLQATGAISYAWSPSTGLLNDSIPNPISGGGNFDTTTYIVTGTDINGCQNTDTITVFVLFPFTVTYPNDTCYCIGESSELCAISTTQSTFKWKPLTGIDSSNAACVLATPIVNTTYTIYVSDSLGCYADTGQVEICIYPLPSVISSPDETILVGTIAQLTAYHISNPGTGTYQWLPDSTLTCYGCEDPIANPLISTIYIVTLTDLNGCKDEDTTVITVYCNDNVLFVPNAFTPNGDGKNDEFHLDGVGISELHFLKIYNRWGQLVFETTDFLAKWDGKINGKKSEPEVFDYFLEAVCSTGELIRKQGNITLIR